MESSMESIDKKGLKRTECPKCHRPKLRFQHAADGAGPDGGGGDDRSIYCDVCKVSYKESDPAIQNAYKAMLSERTPPPMMVRNH